MITALAYMTRYITTYSNQLSWKKYHKDTWLADILHALGVSVNKDEYSFAAGYDKFMLTEVKPLIEEIESRGGNTTGVSLEINKSDVTILVESLKQSLSDGNPNIISGPSERHIVESLLAYIESITDTYQGNLTPDERDAMYEIAMADEY